MVGRRWLRMLGPEIMVTGALGALGATAPAGPGGPWGPAECADGGRARMAAASVAAPVSVAEVAGAPWFRLDPVIDAGGTLTAHRLTVGINGARLDRTLVLPVAAFAAGPFGGLVLIGSDDGQRSRLASIDVARGCRSSIAESTDVIRGATIDPAARSIFEHRVDRSSRADLGIWQRPLDGTAPARQVLGPIAPDARFGRTWTTGLLWSAEGDRLAVQSCAAVACRTRILDIAAGRATMTDDPRLGLLVGVSGDRLVAHGACRGVPCPLHAVDVASGRLETIEADGGAAVLVGEPGEVSVVVEAFGATGPRLRLVTLDGRRSRDLGTLPIDTRLGGDPGSSAWGIRLTPDHVLLVPGGQLPDTGARSQTSLLSLSDGRTAPFDEVTR